MTDPAAESAPLDLRQVLRVMMRRKWLVLLPWAVALAAGVALAFLLKPIYFSTVTLMLERPRALGGALGGMVGGGINADQQADVMRQQIGSTPFLRSVVTATGIKGEPAVRAWALRAAKRYPGLAPDAEVEAFLTDYLRSAISVRRDKGDVFEVTVGDYEPERARRLADAVANQFVSASKASQLEMVRATQAFSIEQQEIYRRKLEESEGRLEAATRTALGSGAALVTQANLPRARGLLDQANLEVEEQRQKVAALKAQLAGRARENDPQLLSSPRVSTLTAELAELERQYSAALLNEGGGDNGAGARLLITRKFTGLESELAQNAALALPAASADARDLLVRYRLAQADLEARQAGREYFSAQLGGYQRQVALSPDRELEIQRLRQEVENNRALYNSFVQQSAAAQITEAFENARVGGRFAVLEPAVRPTAPGKPNRPVLILLAFVLGGIIGVGTVLVVEKQDESCARRSSSTSRRSPTSGPSTTRAVGPRASCGTGRSRRSRRRWRRSCRGSRSWSARAGAAARRRAPCPAHPRPATACSTGSRSRARSGSSSVASTSSSPGRADARCRTPCWSPAPRAARARPRPPRAWPSHWRASWARRCCWWTSTCAAPNCTARWACPARAGAWRRCCSRGTSTSVSCGRPRSRTSTSSPPARPSGRPGSWWTPARASGSCRRRPAATRWW
ncbi:MAG: hypothetical protein HZC42_02210 [Candidatus Eisenbacteria bacterium]|nr:hypothetical protein [Candidatus Eisenbacteria bacterium]